MQDTKNDLSFNRAELDYAALITTAQVAYHHCLNEIDRYREALRRPSSNSSRYLDAGWLCREADNLVIVAETLATLLGGLEREEIEVVNKSSLKGDNDDKLD